MLREEGALDFSRSEASRLTGLASEALRKAAPRGVPGDALAELVSKLLDRES